MESNSQRIFGSDELDDLLSRYRDFLKEHVYPVELSVVSKPFSHSSKLLKELRSKAKELNLWNPHLSIADGGLGLSLPDFAQVSELLGTSPLGHYLCNCHAPDIGNMELMHQFASPELQEKYLKPLWAGDIRSCFAMTEPMHAGSNPVNMSTTAVLEDDKWVINGHKWFTTGADGAAFTIVMAQTDPNNENPYLRASMILVPLDTPGYELVRNIPIMGEAGDEYLSHGEVKFKDVRVPKSNLIGKEGQGFALAQERLGPGRIHHCMRWIGICERAFDLMCQRMVDRELAAGKTLAHQQSLHVWVAELRAQINASRLMVMHTAYDMDKKGAKAVKEEISTIKFFVADVLMQTLDKAIQVHGALGITDDTLLSFWYRHERGSRIYDGPDEVHKTVLARKILKTYGATR
ncbi:MAG: acyl-CoA dehydrogenase family protein [Cyclobacteriaceae bacterium]|nr:acyl-CoA dehydrogenase family protein [Cyclobacteriaceae bacterium]MCH8516346.1 acyl-CoA dehydrogenase family protein [Cyclobacteriaceae bacterium]